MASAAATIDTERFLRDLDDLREIGRYRTGRPSPDLLAAGHGKPPLADGADGGVRARAGDGRHRQRARPAPGPGPHLLVGSHIETQNEAGWLDGALGVVAGLALARAGLPVDVVAFADEEGHFEGGFLGSRSAIGALTEEEIDRSREPQRRHAAARGPAPTPASPACRACTLDRGRYHGFLEMHIEQGTQLEGAGRAGRRRDRHRRHLAVADRRRGPAGPCRRHHHGRAARRRPVRRAPARRHRPGVPARLRRAHHLDHRPHRAGARRAVRHPGPRRGAVPVPRRRRAGAGAAGSDAPRPGAGEQPARALHRHAGADVARHAGALRSRPAWRPWPPRPRRGRPASGGGCPPAPGTTRSGSAASCLRRCCSCPRSAASATTGPRTPSARTWRSAARCWPTRPRASCAIRAARAPPRGRRPA